MPLARLAVFLAVVGLVTAALHRYLWVRLVRDPAWPEPWRGVATWSIAALAVSILVALVFNRALPRVVAEPLVWTSYTWLGAMFFLFVVLLAAEPVALFTGREPATARVAAVIVAAIASAACVAGVVSTSGSPGVARVTIPVRDLDPRLQGFRIVQISDVHVGPTIGRAFVEEVVRVANGLDADVVTITGDLVDGTVEHLAPAVEPLRELRSRHGTYFVTGNHEYYSDPEAWTAHLATLGIRVLRNERVTIDHGGAALDVAGVDDPTGNSFGRPPDMTKALADRDTTHPVVLLAHQPVAVHEASANGVDLQLSGHTHGGQLWPFGALVRLAQPAVAGLHRFGGTWLYVSCGTGYWGPPMRLGAPSEITLLELVRE
jgi:predicted MPP superfamily phosphohydrolase